MEDDACPWQEFSILRNMCIIFNQKDIFFRPKRHFATANSWKVPGPNIWHTTFVRMIPVQRDVPGFLLVLNGIRYVWLYLVLLKYLVCRIHKMPSKIPENICLYHNTWPKQYWLLYIWLYLVMNIPGIFWKYLFNQGTIGCTPNSVPMVFITFCRDSWG